MAGQPAKYKTPEELQAAIDAYFDMPNCPNTITGLAYYLGFADRQSLNDYQERPEYSFIIKRARARVEMAYEEKLSSNTVTGAIFALKNMGWKDKTEIDQTVRNAPVLVERDANPQDEPIQ
jgi:hypothetical protein